MHGTGVGLAQRALLGTIDDGLSAVGRAQDELDSKAHLPPLGDDAVSNKHFSCESERKTASSDCLRQVSFRSPEVSVLLSSEVLTGNCTITGCRTLQESERVQMYSA